MKKSYLVCGAVEDQHSDDEADEVDADEQVEGAQGPDQTPVLDQLIRALRLAPLLSEAPEIGVHVQPGGETLLRVGEAKHRER